MSSTLYSHLSRYSPADWAAAVDTLSASVHPIDQNATRIWFAFFPLKPASRAGSRGGRAEREAAVVQTLRLMGRWRLVDQIDSSHAFLFAHRYWPQVKSAVTSFDQSITEATPLRGGRHVGRGGRGAHRARRSRDARRDVRGGAHDAPPGRTGRAHGGARTDSSGGCRARAVAASGHEAAGARRLAGSVRLPARPHEALDGDVRRERFGREVRRHQRPGDRDGGADRQAGLSRSRSALHAGRGTDSRRVPRRVMRHVLGRRARRRRQALAGRRSRRAASVQMFGYLDSQEPKPLIRLACQAKAHGAVSIVIPPWNGFLSKQA